MLAVNPRAVILSVAKNLSMQIGGICYLLYLYSNKLE